MVQHEQEKYGWEFVFLAANIDAVETGCSIGVRMEQAVNYQADYAGSACMYRTVSQAVSNVRENRRLASDKSWRKEADEDFKNRNR